MYQNAHYTRSWSSPWQPAALPNVMSRSISWSVDECRCRRPHRPGCSRSVPLVSPYFTYYVSVALYTTVLVLVEYLSAVKRTPLQQLSGFLHSTDSLVRLSSMGASNSLSFLLRLSRRVDNAYALPRLYFLSR